MGLLDSLTVKKSLSPKELEFKLLLWAASFRSFFTAGKSHPTPTSRRRPRLPAEWSESFFVLPLFDKKITAICHSAARAKPSPFIFPLLSLPERTVPLFSAPPPPGATPGPPPVASPAAATCHFHGRRSRAAPSPRRPHLVSLLELISSCAAVGPPRPYSDRPASPDLRQLKVSADLLLPSPPTSSRSCVGPDRAEI